MTLAILETALYADDLDAAEAFYRDVLGLAVFVKAPGRHVFFKCDRHMLLLFAPDATAKGPASGQLPVPPHGASAGEIEPWRQRLVAHGIAIEADFLWPSGGRSIYFRDPAGNSLEFAEPKIWGF